MLRRLFNDRASKEEEGQSPLTHDGRRPPAPFVLIILTNAQRHQGLRLESAGLWHAPSDVERNHR